MELWVAFGFGAAVGALVGYLLGRRRQVPLAVARPAPPSQPPPSSKPSTPSNVKHVLLDEGSANVLNALNNRLAAIGDRKSTRVNSQSLAYFVCRLLLEKKDLKLNPSARSSRAGNPEWRRRRITTG